jgi:hypothetical protein
MTQPLLNGDGGISGIMGIRLHDVAALIDAQTAMISGLADLVGRCQTEAMRAVMNAATAIPWSDPPKDLVSGIVLTFDTWKSATLDTTARSNVLTEIASRTSTEAAGVLSSRWLAALDDWKAILTAAVRPAEAP